MKYLLLLPLFLFYIHAQAQTEISDSEVVSIIQQPNAGFCVLEFYRPDCVHCANVEPVYKELANSFGNDVRFFKLNTDNSRIDYGIAGTPTFIYFYNGVVQDKSLGLSLIDFQTKLYTILSDNSSKEDNDFIKILSTCYGDSRIFPQYYREHRDGEHALDISAEHIIEIYNSKEELTPKEQELFNDTTEAWMYRMYEDAELTFMKITTIDTEFEGRLYTDYLMFPGEGSVIKGLNLTGMNNIDGDYLGFADGEEDPLGEGVYVHTEYYKNKEKKLFITYENEDANGAFESYYENGDLRSKGSYKDSKRDGFWQYYLPGGRLYKSGDYLEGEKVGQWIVNDLYLKQAYANIELLKSTYPTLDPVLFDKLKDGISYKEKINPWKKFADENGKVYYEGGSLASWCYNSQVGCGDAWEFRLGSKYVSLTPRTDSKPEVRTFYDANRIKTSVEERVNGKSNGKAIFYDSAGNVTQEGLAKDDYREGKWTFYKKGVKNKEVYFDKGKEGTFVNFFTSGNVSREGQVENNVLHGEITSYYDNPNKVVFSKEMYKNGSRDGVSTWYYENGQVEQEILYAFKDKDMYGYRMEVLSSYNSDGSAREKGTLKKGNGTILQYDAQGNLTGQTTYRKGVEVE